MLSCSCLTVGASHDATAWAASQLAQDLDAGLMDEKFSLVADDAYSASSEQIVTPFPGRQLTEDQDAANYWISNSRIEVCWGSCLQSCVLGVSTDTMLCSCLQSECAFGEIMRRWSILTAPLQHDLATAMLIFRVCCKLHNFCVAERDTFSGMTGAADDMSGHTMVGAVPRPNPVQLTGGDEPMPRNLHGRQSSKVRRHAWMLALKAAGKRRKPRAN